MSETVEEWGQVGEHCWVHHRIGIDPEVADAPPALLPVLPVDTPMLHGVPEPIYIFISTTAKP